MNKNQKCHINFAHPVGLLRLSLESVMFRVKYGRPIFFFEFFLHPGNCITITPGTLLYSTVYKGR